MKISTILQPFDLLSLCKETPKSTGCNDATDRTIMLE